MRISKITVALLFIALSAARADVSPDRLKQVCTTVHEIDPLNGALGKPVDVTEKEHVYAAFDSVEGKIKYVATDGDNRIDPSPLSENIIVDCSMAGVPRSGDSADSNYCRLKDGKFTRLKKDDSTINGAQANIGIQRSARVYDDSTKRWEWIKVSKSPEHPLTVSPH